MLFLFYPLPGTFPAGQGAPRLHVQRGTGISISWLLSIPCPLLFLVVLARIVFHPGATLLLSELKGERWFAVWVVGLPELGVSLSHVRGLGRSLAKSESRSYHSSISVSHVREGRVVSLLVRIRIGYSRPCAEVA